MVVTKLFYKLAAMKAVGTHTTILTESARELLKVGVLARFLRIYIYIILSLLAICIFLYANYSRSFILALIGGNLCLHLVSRRFVCTR